MKIGIVGLPNVGKSSLFNALTKNPVPAENYPFCTIEPNVGIVGVPDERLQKLTETSHSVDTIPTAVEFFDIAGLVAGAHKGEGLGNKFLSHIKETDALVHLVRAFSNDDITHVDGSIDPGRDIETINLELVMSDLVLVTKHLENAEGKARSGDKEAQEQLEVFTKIKNALDAGTSARDIDLNEDEQVIAAPLNLLTIKPMLYVFNVEDPQNLPDNLPNLPGAIALNIQTEVELSQVPDEEIADYLKELKLDDTGLHKVIKTSYKLLDLITFFTSGPKETRAWTVEKGAKAPRAAGKIHSDMEKGFIRAEVIAWDTLVESGSESAARDKGLLRLEGKEYVMQDGDVCHFKFAV